MRSRLRLASRLLTIALCLLAGGAAAMDPTLALAQLHRTRWTTREGAPAAVNALAQTPDGALWIAASTGLVRFDGVRFERFSPRPGEASLAEDLSCLFVGPDGALWIGARLGGVHVLRADRLTSFGAREGLPANTVLAIARTADGITWAGTTNGLYALAGARWQRVGAERGVAASYVSSLLVDARGALWVTGLDGTFELAPGAPRFERRSEGGDGAGQLARGPDGRAWQSNKRHGVQALGGTAPGVATDGRALGDRDPSITPLLFDRDGGLWLGLGDGLARLVDGRRLDGPAPLRAQALREVEHLAPAGTHPDARPEALLEDREGNLWSGSEDGLERLRPVKLRAATPGGARWPSAALAIGPAGVVQAARLDGDRVVLAATPVPRPRRAGAPEVSAYAITADGTEWTGGVGALVREAGGLPPMRVPTPSPQAVVQALSPERADSLWVSMVHGDVYRWRDGAWSLHGGVDGLPTGPAMCLSVGTDGRLWAGYADDRLALVAGGAARLFGAAEGLHVGAVLALAPQGDDAWVGGSGGLALYHGGRFWSAQRPDGSDITGVSGIALTTAGELWVNGAAGVTRIDAAELARFVADPSRRVAVETFDYDDGLDGIAPQLRPLPTAIAGSDGRLWFATSRDLFWLDPAHVARNRVAPSVRILRVTAGGAPLEPAPGLALPVGTSRFAFDYTAFSLTLPERVRFRYQLEGVDAGWQDAGTRRQAFYTNVPPGRYAFRVLAANEDGLWNEVGARLEFTIPPAFWQTRWFDALCALAALALLWRLYTLRLRRLAARIAGERDAQLQERERIARELHDTLLQSTQGLILNFQGFASQLPADSAMRAKMEATLDRADDVLADARHRVLDLRGPGLAEHALPEALAQAASELAGDAATAVRIVVEGHPRELNPAIEEECHRIAREALANAFAHAQASAIDVRIVHGPLALRLRVRDDGRGIAPEVLAAGGRPGHFGLLGMRERAERFGARLELWSRAGLGTEIELTVPAAIAYRRAPRGHWWRKWRK